MLRLPRTSYGFLFLIVVLVAAGIDLLTLPKGKPLAALIGRWSGDLRSLEVESSGYVTFSSKAGKVESGTGGHFVSLLNDTLTYRVFFVPMHLRIDRGPIQDTIGWALWIEGEQLRRLPQ